MSGGERQPERRARAAPRRRPSTSAPARTNRSTCRRVAPAARSRPTSRTRSPTVIDSVLKMRNAPTNSVIAATSASSPGSRPSRRAATRRGRAATRGRTARGRGARRAPAATSARGRTRSAQAGGRRGSTPLGAEDAARRRRSGATTVRPRRRRPARRRQDPDDPDSVRAAGPEERRARCRARRPSSRASRSVMSGAGLVAAERAATRPRAGRSWTRASTVGSMPRTVTGVGRGRPRPASRRGRSAARSPARRRRRPASSAIASTRRLGQAGLGKAATRRSARPTRSATVRSIDRVEPGVRWPATRTGRRRRARCRAIVRSVRGGARGEAAPGEARSRPRIGRLEAELGEPGDQRRRGVVVAPAEDDLLADRARRR